jgi:hypothetical protein
MRTRLGVFLTRVPLVALALASSAAHAVQPLTAPPTTNAQGAVAIPDGAYPVVSTVTRLTEGDARRGGLGELPGCPNLDHTVWYSFTPSVSSFYRISTCQGKRRDRQHGLRHDRGRARGPSAGAARPRPCWRATTVPWAAPRSLPSLPSLPTGTRPSPWPPLTGGETYFIVAGHWAPNAGGVAAPWDDIAVQVDKVPSPLNDTCTSPVPLALTQGGARDDGLTPMTTTTSTNCYNGVWGTWPRRPWGGTPCSPLPLRAMASTPVRYIQDATEAAPLASGFSCSTRPTAAPLPGSDVSCFAGANRVGTGRVDGTEQVGRAVLHDA